VQALARSLDLFGFLQVRRLVRRDRSSSFAVVIVAASLLRWEDINLVVVVVS
jgi:hypothetical protein